MVYLDSLTLLVDPNGVFPPSTLLLVFRCPKATPYPLHLSDQRFDPSMLISKNDLCFYLPCIFTYK